MDLFNRILVGRWQSPLVRLFGMKSVGSPVPTLAPEIAPSIDVNQRDDATLAFLRAERLCAGWVSFTASVGNVNYCQVRNPSGSGLLFEIEAVMANAIMYGGVALQTTDYTAATQYIRDGRWLTLNGTLSPAARFTSTQAPGIISYRTVRYNGGGTYEETPFIVPPGQAFQLETAATNVGNACGILWRERPFDPSELSTG